MVCIILERTPVVYLTGPKISSIYPSCLIASLDSERMQSTLSINCTGNIYFMYMVRSSESKLHIIPYKILIPHTKLQLTTVGKSEA